MYLDGCFLSVIVSLICFVKKVGSGVEKSSCKIENAMDLLLYEIATHNGLKLFLKENLYFFKFLLHFHERYLQFLYLVVMNHGLRTPNSKKPFFIKIPNFWDWADNLGR